METAVEAPPETRQTSESEQAAVPLLRNADRLTRAEFERRYEAMPRLKKAERIERKVHMLASIRFHSHGRPHSLIMGWLSTYAAATPGVWSADNASARLDPDNDPQPDALLMIDPACGGQARISGDDYLDGAPELAVEVAASSASYDLYEKKRVYRRNGVREYLVWRVEDEALDWFVLEDERYAKLEPGDDGLLESRVFPGLRLDAGGLLGGNGAAVLEAARAGTQTDAHGTFVEKLDGQRETDG